MLCPFGDFIDELDVGEDDAVGMVGYFGPFIPKLKKICKKLYIFERGMRKPETLPDTAAEYILPEVDVAILTGSAIVNKSLEHLLELAKNAREIGVVGPSTSFIPDPLFKRGATIVGGIEVHRIYVCYDSEVICRHIDYSINVSLYERSGSNISSSLKISSNSLLSTSTGFPRLPR